MKTLLFNPFKIYSEKQLFAFGLIVMVLGIAGATHTNTHFDGVLDTHFGNNVSLLRACVESLVNTFSLVAVFYVCGKWINPKTRVIDILNMALLVKVPSLLVMPLNYNGWMFHQTNWLLEKATPPLDLNFSVNEILFLLLLALVSILVLVWFFVLLYNGFKTATNLKQAAHIVAFVICIFIAEILSKIFLNTISIS